MTRWCALLAGLLLLVAACSDEKKTSPPTGGAPVPLPAPAFDVGGRTAGVEDVPAALAPGAKMSVEPVSATEPYRKDRGRSLVGPVWRFHLEGQPEAKPAFPLRVHLPYDPNAVREEDVVRVSRWDGRQWEPMPDSEADPLAGVVTASVDHFSVFAPTSARGVRELGRWYGTSRREQDFGGEHPLLWAQTPWTRTETFRWQVREEFHERLMWRRIVFENAAWELVETRFDWIGGKRAGLQKGSSFPGQQPLRLGKAYGEADLNRPLTGEERARLDEAKRRVASLQARSRDLVHRYGEAAVGSLERERIATELHDVVQPGLKSAQFDVDELEFLPRPMIVGGTVTHGKDAATGAWTVTIDARLDDLEPRQYVRTWLGSPSLSYDGKIVPQAPLSSDRVFSLKSIELSGPVGSVLRVAKPGEGGWETHEYSGLAPETEDEPRITVRGHVYHRIHLPQGAARGNFVGSGGAGGTPWGSIAPRLFPVGRVRVELFRRGAEQASFPVLPMASAHSADDGAFAVTGSVQRGDVLRIRSTYDLADAQLLEGCTIDVPMVVLAEHGVLGDAPSIQADWMATRKCEVEYRHEGKRVRHDLGDDARPCVLRRDREGKLSLEFNGMNSLLVNTFCVRGRHLNQILNPFDVDVDARVAEIQAGCPADLKEACDARLAADVEGGKTKVKFQGYEVCYAASTTMALDALWLQALAPDGDAQQTQIREVSQAVYEHLKATIEASRAVVDAAVAGGRRPRAAEVANVWDYPFSTAAARDAARAERARLAAAGTTPDKATATRLAAVLDPFTETWPYVAADANDDNKNWLLSQGGYRPWQWVHVTNSYLQGRFGDRLAIEAHVNASDRYTDAFDAATHPEVVFRLGGGAVGMISIDHRGAGSTPTVPKRGGHVMALVGVVITTQGNVVRLLMNDPYGDLSEHPAVDGYYGLPGNYNRSDPDKDFDPVGHKGGYAPYGNWPHISPAWEGRIASKWLCFYWRPDMASVSDIGERLLKVR